MPIPVDVDIRGRNADLLRSIAGSKLALGDLQRSSRSWSTSMSGDMRRVVLDSQSLERQLNRTRNEAGKFSVSFVNMRNVLRNMAVQTAIGGFDALAASLNAIVGASTLALASVTKLAVGISTQGVAAMLALGQAAVVAKLAFANVAKAITATGTAQQTAFDKLTRPARQFVLEVRSLKATWADFQVVAQKGVFPGVLEGLKQAERALPQLRNALYDTGRTMGWLAEQFGKVIGDRRTDIYHILETNVVTLRRLGETGLNLFRTFIDVFRAASPFIDHFTARMVVGSEHLAQMASSARRDGALQRFFSDISRTTDQWFHALKDVGLTIYNIFHALNPTLRTATNGVLGALDAMQRWSASLNGQRSIGKFFHDLLPVMEAMFDFIGKLTAAIVTLGTHGNDMAVKVWDGLSNKVLPLLSQIFDMLSANLLPAMGHLVTSFVEFAQTAARDGILRYVLDGLSAVATAASKVLDFFTGIVKQAEGMGKLTGTLAELGIAAAVILSWKTLTDTIVLARVAMSNFLATGATGITGAQARAQILPLVGGAGERGMVTPDVAAARTAGYMPVAGGFTRWAPRYEPPTYVTEGGNYLGAATGRPYPNAARVTTGGRVLGVTNAAGTMPAGGRYAAYQNALASAVGMDRTGGGGFAATWLRNAKTGVRQFGANVADGVAEGVRTGMARAKPFIKGGFVIGGVSGIIGALSSKAPNFAGRVHDATSAATFGLLPSWRDNADAHVQQFARELGGGALTDRFFGLKNVDFSRLPNRGAAFSQASQGATRTNKQGNEVLDLANPKAIGALNVLVDGLAKAGQISDDDAVKLHDMVTKFKAGLDSVGGNFAAFKQGLNFGGQTSKAVTDFTMMADAIRGVGADTHKTLGEIVKDTNYAVAQINGTLGNGSKSAQLALAQNFKTAAKSVYDSMAAAGKFTKAGMAQMEAYLTQGIQAEFGAAGVKLNAKQAANYARGLDTTGQTLVHGGQSGLMVIGNEGAVGGDNVPLMLNRRPVLAAEGENIAIFNRHQRAYLNDKLSQEGGLSGFFNNFRRPHQAASGGFFPALGTNYTVGQEPEIARRLDRLGRALHLHLIGLSGYRSPQHSVEVGGFANDPHTRGMASDTPGIEAVLEAVLNRFGLDRPFGGAAEADHIQLWGSAPGGAIGRAVAGAGAAAATKVVKALKMPGASLTGASGGVGNFIGMAMGKASATGDAILQSIASGLSGGAGGNGQSAGSGAGYPHINGGKYGLGALAKLWTGAGGPSAISGLMARIAYYGESGGDTNAYNPISVGGLHAEGLWQIVGQLVSGNLYDAKVNAANAVAKWRQQGLVAWLGDKVYNREVPGHYRTGPGQYARGGMVDWEHALMASAGAPPIGGQAPPTSPADTQTNAAAKAKAKAKAKNKKPGPSYAPTPHRKAPYGTGLLHGPRPRKEVLARKRRIHDALATVKAVTTQPFDMAHLAQGAVDPVTGEDRGIGRVPLAHSLFDAMKTLPGLQDIINNISVTPHSLQNEAPIVTLQDYEGGPNDLSNYLRDVLHVDPAKWIVEHGDSLDVPNLIGGDAATGHGMTVAGKFVPGIHEHVAYDQSIMNADQALLAWADDAKGKAQAVRGTSGPMLTELRQRLKGMKGIFDANRRVRDAAQRKLTRMSQRGYDYKKAVADNRGLITAWQHVLRDGSHLPKDYRTSVNHIIDKLRTTNVKLNQQKPASGHPEDRWALSDNIAVSDTVVKYLTGDPNATSWPPQGGAGGALLRGFDQWRALDDYTKTSLDDIKAARTPVAANVDTLRNDMSDWVGTRVDLKPLNRNPSANATELLNLQKQISDDALKNLALMGEQFKVFSGFAPLAAGRVVGSFARGGIIPETGMALVHKDERIYPDPDGPFRRGENALSMAASGGGHVEVHLHGDLGGVVERAIVKRAGQISDMVSQRQGRRTRLISAAPGGR